MTTETIHGLLFYLGVFSTGYGVGLLFIFVVVALFAVYGHWSTSIWMETIQ